MFTASLPFHHTKSRKDRAMKKHADTVLLLSGGLDSAVALFELVVSGHGVICVYIEHGQAMGEFRKITTRLVREAKKLSEAMWKTRLVKLESVRISDLWKGAGRLEDQAPDVMFGRNLVYLSMAATFAARYQATDIAFSVHMEDGDEPGAVYPDQSEEFIMAAQKAISQGLGINVNVTTPVWGCSEAELFYAAHRMGVLDLILGTVSCMTYFRKRKLDLKKHDWGRGCGSCSSCEVRSEGWRVFQGMLEDDERRDL